MAVPDSLPKGLFLAAITPLGSLSQTVLLFVRATMMGIRDGGLFSSGFSVESIKMRCFLSASSLDEEPFQLLLFKGVNLRTGILDFCWTEERRSLSPLISRLGLYAIAFVTMVLDAKLKTTTFSKLWPCFIVWFCSVFRIFSLVCAWKILQFSCSEFQCWPHL